MIDVDVSSGDRIGDRRRHGDQRERGEQVGRHRVGQLSSTDGGADSLGDDGQKFGMRSMGIAGGDGPNEFLSHTNMASSGVLPGVDHRLSDQFQCTPKVDRASPFDPVGCICREPAVELSKQPGFGLEDPEERGPSHVGLLADLLDADVLKRAGGEKAVGGFVEHRRVVVTSTSSPIEGLDLLGRQVGCGWAPRAGILSSRFFAVQDPYFHLAPFRTRTPWETFTPSTPVIHPSTPVVNAVIHNLLDLTLRTKIVILESHVNERKVRSCELRYSKEPESTSQKFPTRPRATDSS